MMDGLGVGHEQNFPVSSPNAHTPIEVFGVEEILFIEQAYIRDRLQADHHAGAGNRLDLDWPLRERIAVKKEIGESEGEQGEEPTQPSRSNSLRKDERRLRQPAPSPGLLRAVRIKQKRAYHPDTVGRPQSCDRPFDGTLCHPAVGVEQKHIFGSRPHKREIVAGGEAEVCCIADDS